MAQLGVETAVSINYDNTEDFLDDFCLLLSDYNFDKKELKISSILGRGFVLTYQQQQGYHINHNLKNDLFPYFLMIFNFNINS